MTERLTYSVKEAADALGVSKWRVREGVRTGRIESVRLGSRILIPRLTLERLVNMPQRATNDTANINDVEAATGA